MTLDFFAGWSDIEAVQRLITSQLAAGGHNWFGHNAVFTYDHSASLALVNQHTLVLTNTGDIAHHFSVRTRESFPEFAYRELEGGTALIVDEQPEAWTRTVVTFLQTGGEMLLRTTLPFRSRQKIQNVDRPSCSSRAGCERRGVTG